jgi:hypothetical protein
MRRRLDCFCHVFLAAAIVAGLAGCGKSSPTSSPAQNDLETSSSQASSSASANPKFTPAKSAAPNQTDSPVWLDAAREDPDPRVRLHAIETWAIKPGKSLDPVTYALVDPDETVRARAQELFEEALERR